MRTKGAEAETIDGSTIARQLNAKLRLAIDEFAVRHRPPRLAVVLVGDDFASHVYVRRKRKACHEVGIANIDVELPQDVSEQEINDQINKLNADTSVDGILIQLPLPKHLDAGKIIEIVKPNKDVDGLHPVNQGLLASGKPLHVPCTPLGVMSLLEHSKCPVEGQIAAVVGRSVLVGSPVSRLLLQANATVINLHSRTVRPEQLTRQADILVAAVGIPHLVSGDWIKPGAVVIDVGVNRTIDGLVGDVNYREVRRVAAKLTPVPGGVGPMTIAMLLANTFKAAQLNVSKRQ